MVLDEKKAKQEKKINLKINWMQFKRTVEKYRMTNRW